MEWLEDKEKDGELFTNSICFSYVLKCFKKENRVEIWTKWQGYMIQLETEEEAILTYSILKRFDRLGLYKYVEEHMKKIGN